jgi:hypothetical protein
MTTKEIEAARRIEDEARRNIPAGLLQVGGRALYSPAATLISGSPYYFLGLNPGAVADDTQVHSQITIDADLKRLASGQISEHGYLDEKWKNFPVGEAPIQVRGQQLFAILVNGSIADGKDALRETPTSNFVLPRSASVVALKKEIGKKIPELALLYWPFHQAVIQQTKCRVVISHAVGPAKNLAQALGWHGNWVRPSGWGGSLDSCYAWELPEGPMLLAIPNLSRYQPNGLRTAALAAFFKEFALI